MRRHDGGMPLQTDLSLAMRTAPLALIIGATEFVAVIYGPAVTVAFPDVKVELTVGRCCTLTSYQHWTEVHLTGESNTHYEN